MSRSIAKVNPGIGPGSGELTALLQDMQKDIADLATKLNAHLQDGSHTAASNTTAGNITANTMGALRVSQ
jgi:hypothetical protein